MRVPPNPPAGVAVAITDALAAAGIIRALSIGEPALLLRDALSAHLELAGGALSILDNAWDALMLPHHGESCAWILSQPANYYTTYDQIYAIRTACRRHDMPLLVIIPQLVRAVARRDHYEDLDAIPLEWQQDSEGCVRDGVAMQRALLLGGLRNGVLTAIEDIIGELRDEGTSFAWAHLPALGGMCALFEADADWAHPFASRLARFHGSGIVAAMNEHEIRAYLATLDHGPNRVRGRKQ